MTETLRVACVQPSSGQDMQANLDAAGALVREARAAGAELIALPENVALMEHRTELVQANAHPLAAHPAALFFGALAEEPLHVHGALSPPLPTWRARPGSRPPAARWA